MLKVIFIYYSLVFAERTTICKNLKNKVRCTSSSEVFLPNARSLDACPSECEKAGAGAKGCCEWQHDWKLCSWYTDQRQIQPVEGDEYRSAVLCSSKYNEVVVYNCTDFKRG